MATRNRTNLYLSYRQSYAHHPTHSYSQYSAPSTEELDTLISKRADTVIEMDILPPSWTDATAQVDDILTEIAKMSTRLDKLHAQHVLPGFDDKSQEEGEIERLTSEIHQVTTLSNIFLTKQPEIP
jgi:syntaxin 16